MNWRKPNFQSTKESCRCQKELVRLKVGNFVSCFWKFVKLIFFFCTFSHWHFVCCSLVEEDGLCPLILIVLWFFEFLQKRKSSTFWTWWTVCFFRHQDHMGVEVNIYFWVFCEVSVHIFDLERMSIMEIKLEWIMFFGKEVFLVLLIVLFYFYSVSNGLPRSKWRYYDYVRYMVDVFTVGEFFFFFLFDFDL